MDFKNLNLSDFIRYVLSGFNFLLFVLIIPLLYLFPNKMENILNQSSFLMVSLLSIAIGYLIDILKFYQLTPEYNAKKAQFWKNMVDLLEIPKAQRSSYFALIKALSRKYSSYDLEQQQSKWVLVSHTAITFSISTIIWFSILIYHVLRSTISTRLIIPIIAIFILYSQLAI